MDHGSLSGKDDDDHTEYVHIGTARTITALHTLSHALGILTNTISERTAGAGVIIDGVRMRDEDVNAPGDVVAGATL